ncbi:uncharacterized protein LOC142219847 [Haematobia irritans]|uniref:uncharacterized protein LOC142219847 n=1 Tax=Haematobia irritans TaxID=7368 RepID=UPI003F4FFD34
MGVFPHFIRCRYVSQSLDERLEFIRFNQANLRSEDYIHLRDAIHSQYWTSGGSPTILYRKPTSHARIRSRRYDLRGTPDLFITFTCNPKWTEIELFGNTRCYMYSVEWVKRGLPHARILIWLLNKLHSNEVDDIISAEVPDPVTDHHLHDIVTTQMVHGPCGALNPLSPWMADGKCTKRYPRPLVAETVTGNDGYPVYRRSSKEDNGRTIKVKDKNQDIEIGNEFIVPYCPLLSRIFETHTNVESYHSAKSIKYLCKYVTKGSDMAVFGIASENANDKVSNFQMGRYVSTNEALWRLFSFQIHERYPTVVHWAVHLENGQRVYFTKANAAQRAERPLSTTLISFFAMCEADLKDLRRRNNTFGGLIILLAGDFRQTLPVIPRGTPADELNACLKASPLWNDVKILSLTTNMKVTLQNDHNFPNNFQLLDMEKSQLMR